MEINFINLACNRDQMNMSQTIFSPRIEFVETKLILKRYHICSAILMAGMQLYYPSESPLSFLLKKKN